MIKDEKDNLNQIIEADENPSKKSKKDSSNKPLIILLVTIGVLLIISTISVAGNIFAFTHERSGFAVYANNMPRLATNARSSMMSGRIMGGGNVYRNSATNTNNVISGVVTSIGDNSFTLSGNGSQYTIKTTGSTTYNTTGKKVVVNDSVLTIGTLADKTLTATDIQIINR